MNSWWYRKFNYLQARVYLITIIYLFLFIIYIINHKICLEGVVAILKFNKTNSFI